ncbi:MAG: hypothetical protein RLZZ297_1318 [Chloroflexota bacterium]
MAHDAHTALWPESGEAFFREREIHVQRQTGPHCVATSLAMITGASPADFIGRMNTQNPATWSDALAAWQLQLAYCPTDVRRVRHYLPELLTLDDLFTLSYYTTRDAARILAEPNERGWVTGSHVVVLHRDTIYDPASGSAVPARAHPGIEYHTKRIFRVVPLGYPRKL